MMEHVARERNELRFREGSEIEGSMALKTNGFSQKGRRSFEFIFYKV